MALTAVVLDAQLGVSPAVSLIRQTKQPAPHVKTSLSYREQITVR